MSASKKRAANSKGSGSSGAQSGRAEAGRAEAGKPGKSVGALVGGANESATGFFGSGGFLDESVQELKKVTTPTKQETIQATLVTLVIMTFVSICLFLMDWFFSVVMRNVV
jgi:preprotein translocase SecE subunit